LKKAFMRMWRCELVTERRESPTEDSG